MGSCIVTESSSCHAAWNYGTVLAHNSLAEVQTAVHQKQARLTHSLFLFAQKAALIGP